MCPVLRYSVGHAILWFAGLRPCGVWPRFATLSLAGGRRRTSAEEAVADKALRPHRVGRVVRELLYRITLGLDLAGRRRALELGVDRAHGVVDLLDHAVPDRQVGIGQQVFHGRIRRGVEPLAEADVYGRVDDRGLAVAPPDV